MFNELMQCKILVFIQFCLSNICFLLTLWINMFIWHHVQPATDSLSLMSPKTSFFMKKYKY